MIWKYYYTKLINSNVEMACETPWFVLACFEKAVGTV